MAATLFLGSPIMKIMVEDENRCSFQNTIFSVLL
jgi:hypothetical protein